jgi:Ni,Fe-hydrogenase maturation factor
MTYLNTQSLEMELNYTQTLQNADKIVVVDATKVEGGKYEELLKQGGKQAFTFTSLRIYLP